MYHHVDVGKVVQDFVFLNGQKLAILNNGNTLFFVIGDHLGSSDLVTDATGTATEYRDYTPFGTPALTQILSDSKNDYLFTGKEVDGESTLQYFGARYLSNSLARFNSIDPVLLALQNDQVVEELTGKKLAIFLSDPQMLNAYAYVGNNPLIFVDSDGNARGDFGRYVAGGQRQIAQFFHSYASYLGSQNGPQNKISAFANDAIGDFANNVANIYDPDAQPMTRALSLGLTALDVGTVGGGSAGIKVGTKFGKLGEVISNQAGKITGFERLGAPRPYHGIDRAIERGINPETILNTVREPLITLRQAGDNILYLTRQAGVVLNSAGKVVTMYAKEDFLPHAIDVLNLLIPRQLAARLPWGVGC